MSDETQEADQESGGELLVDLSEVVKHDYIRDSAGKVHLLRNIDDLGALTHHRLTHAVEEHDKLNRKPELDEAEGARLEQLLEEALEIVLDAPKTVRRKLSPSQKRKVIAHFQRASQPVDEQAAMLRMLAGALRMASQEEETEDPSTTES